MHAVPGGTVFGHKLEHDLSEGCIDGRDIFLQCQNCGRYHKISLGCGKRFDYFCPACAKRWRKKTFKRYYPGVLAMKNPKILTLTLLKIKGRLTERLKGLWEMRKALFRILEERGYHVKSWCGVVEPPNHIHIVIDTERFIPKDLISTTWKTLTGDSYIVDIRELKGDLRAIAAYITKYLTKASAWTGINLDLLKGFHLIGSWRLPPKRPPNAICPCNVKALHRIDDEQFSSDLYYYENNCPLKEYLDRFLLIKGESFIVED